MAHVPADFIQPKGLLSPDWFDDALASAAAYLEEAVTQTAAFTDADIALEAQKAWVYYRAYSLIYEQALMAPAEQRTQETWDRWTEGQIKSLGRIASEHLQAFVRLNNRGLFGQDFIPVVPGHSSRRARRVNEAPFPPL